MRSSGAGSIIVSVVVLLLVWGARAEPVAAIGPASKVHLAQLVLPGGKATRTRGLAALAGALTRRTNITMQRGVKRFGPQSTSLFRMPLLFTTADGPLPLLKPAAVTRLRRHLSRGGTWIIDGPASGSQRAAFRASAGHVAKQLFPRQSLKALPTSHTLWKAFYLLSPDHFQRASLPVEAVVRDGRATILVVQGLTAAPGAVLGRLPEWLTRLAVNLVMYALCVDYKSDQVHAPIIMRRRRWRVP
ncbi:MAG: DUF4159 domain-containing protein [bacterium]